MGWKVEQTQNERTLNHDWTGAENSQIVLWCVIQELYFQ